MSVVYTVGSFQGPLELLLSLIEKEQLPISEVSLARVTGQFLEYVRSMSQFNAELVSRFLAIAATLVAIKAQSLLPVLDLTEEVEADIDELEHRLHMYASLKECAKVLDKHYSQCKPFFMRPPGWNRLIVFVPDTTVTTTVLEQALLDLCEKSTELSITEKEVLPEVRVRSVKSLEEVMYSITEIIGKGNGFKLPTTQPFIDPAERAEALISFLAILELVRGGLVVAHQEEYHDDIVVSVPHS